MLYRLLRRTPFPEAVLPLKMLAGKIRNRGITLPPMEPGTEGDGCLEIVEGTPLLRLRGEPYQLGYQHGRLLAPQIRILWDRFLRVFMGRLKHDLRLARVMEHHIPERFIEEMKGLADGSDLSYEEVLLSVCFLDIHKMAACSTIVVRDGSSRSGEVIMGRNLDFPSLGIAQQANILAVVEPAGRNPFVSITWPSFIGCLSGMNRQGLAMAMMLVYGHPYSDRLEGVPFPLHYRAMLEECDTVAQGIEFFQPRRYAVSNNLMLADRTREAATLELHTGSVGVLRDESEFPVLSCTNHFRTGRRRWSLALTATSSYPRLWEMRRAARQARERGELFDTPEIKAVLRKVARPGFINLQRMIFYPERLEIEVALDKPGGGERQFRYLSRDRLFGGAVTDGFYRD